MFPFKVIQKDLNALSTVLKSSSGGLTMPQIYSEYTNITHPDKRVTKEYLQKVVRYGLTEDVLRVNGHAEKTGRGKAPRKVILTDATMSDDDWETFIQLYRAQVAEETKAKVQKRKKKKAKKVTQVASAPPVEKVKGKTCERFSETRENPNKQFVESFFINTVSQYLGNETARCLVLSGPDYSRHVSKLINSFANEIFIIENQHDVFEKIYTRAKDCPHYQAKRVKLLNCNLEDMVVRACRYIDLDFMCGLKANYSTIISYIRNQAFTVGKGIKKFVTFTASTRNDGGENERLRILKKLLFEAFSAKIERFHGGNGLGAKYPLTKGSQFHYCHKRIPIIIDYGTAIDVQIVTYSDSNHPMLSVLVSYQ